MLERIAIVGSGIAGLSFAACLKQIPSGVKEVLIFDPHGDNIEYSQGGVLGISGGSVVLDAIGMLPELQRYSCKVKQILFTDGKKELININIFAEREVFPSIMKEGETMDPMFYLIRWSALRRLLKDCIIRRHGKFVGSDDHGDVGSFEKSVPEEGMHHEGTSFNAGGTKFTFRPHSVLDVIEENLENEKANLIFRDGTEERGFDLVVGADGVKSVCRRFTENANKTVFGGVQYTGIRVAQCLTPLRGSVGFREHDLNNLLASIRHRCFEEIHQWCGDGANVLTLNVGNGEYLHNALLLIYRERANTNHGQNAEWVNSINRQEEIKNQLSEAGFDQFHDFQHLLELITSTGGEIFEVGVRDICDPLCSWRSNSGRVILIGDSAHAMSPFLGQGANQALQDAFSLANLVARHNQRSMNSFVDRINDSHLQFNRYYFLQGFFQLIYSFLWRIFNFCCVIQPRNASEVQKLGLEFEQRRKFPTFLIAIGARIMGRIITARGLFGSMCKIMFFSFLGWSQLAQYVIFSPMKPVV